MEIDEEKDEEISFSFYDHGSYGMAYSLDNDMRPLVKDGGFTAKTDEDSSTSCFRYGKEPYCEDSVILEYFPSQIDEFVKTLPKDLVDAVVRTYMANADGQQELRVQTPAGPIVAKAMPDDNYPGIIVMNEKEPGQPGLPDKRGGHEGQPEVPVH